MAAKKKTRKKASKKKTTKKKAARKKTTKKKTGRKKAGRKKGARRKKGPLGAELPKSLRNFRSQLRRDLNKIEKQVETAGRNTRRSLTRLVRDASHQLGVLEARGEREWRKLSRRAEQDVKRLMKRVQKAVD